MKQKKYRIIMIFILGSLAVAGADSLWKPGTGYVLQVKALETAADARALVQKLGQAGLEKVYYSTTVKKAQTWYRVRIGGFKDAAAANRKGRELLNRKIITEYLAAADNTTYVVVNGRGITIREMLTGLYPGSEITVPAMEVNMADYALESFTPEQKAENAICFPEAEGTPVYTLSGSYISDLDLDNAQELMLVLNQFLRYTLFPVKNIVVIAGIRDSGQLGILDTLQLEDLNIMDAEAGHYYEINLIKTGNPGISITEKTWQMGESSEIVRNYRLTDKKLKLMQTEAIE